MTRDNLKNLPAVVKVPGNHARVTKAESRTLAPAQFLWIIPFSLSAFRSPSSGLLPPNLYTRVSHATLAGGCITPVTSAL